jgi:hypothetical protein
MWFATVVAGVTVRTDLLGVSSIVRALKLRPALYGKLLGSLHSDAVQFDRLTALWTQIVLRLFPDPLRVNGRPVLVGDGIKVARSGRKMPGVKLLHQQSGDAEAAYANWMSRHPANKRHSFALSLRRSDVSSSQRTVIRLRDQRCFYVPVKISRIVCIDNFTEEFEAPLQ